LGVFRHESSRSTVTLSPPPNSLSFFFIARFSNLRPVFSSPATRPSSSGFNDGRSSTPPLPTPLIRRSSRHGFSPPTFFQTFFLPAFDAWKEIHQGHCGLSKLYLIPLFFFFFFFFFFFPLFGAIQKNVFFPPLLIAGRRLLGAGDLPPASPYSGFSVVRSSEVPFCLG